jgi:hypothetical protein
MSNIAVTSQPGQDSVRPVSSSVRKSRVFLLFVVMITFFVPALLTLHGLKARRVDASTTTGPEITVAAMPAPVPPPSDDQIMSFAYFIEQGDMNSTLRLNNNLLGPMTATVTFFNIHGESFTAPSLTLPPQDVQRFRIADLTANAPGDFHSGSVQVFYHGPAMAVTGQISVASASRHLSFESFPTMSMGFASARLDGIVWMPDAGTQASAALTNTTSDALIVNFGSATGIKSLTLIAHETRVVDLKDFLPNRQDVRAGLIRIEHNGTPGAIIVTGFALNEKTGFSCNLPFVDRATAKTAHLAGAHVRFGKPSSKEGFPGGTRFNAPLLVANTGDQPAEARVFVDYTIAGVAGRAEIAKLELAPNEVRQVEVSSAMTRFVGSGPVDDAGVDIEYSRSPGAVIARLTSADQSGDLAFDVPIKDPLAEMQRVGGSYPWRLDGGFTTVLHLKNTINQSVFALVQVRYNGGSYNLERLPLQPYQTIAVDIRALRDGQQKDIRDSEMPSDVESGQVVWFEETVGSLIGRAETRNVAEGLASSFSCGDTCPCPPASSYAYLTPGSSVGPVGGTGQFSAMEQRQDCRGTVFGPYNRTSDSTWSTSDASVFTVSAGTVSCLHPGNGTVTAQFQATVYGQYCAPITITQNPGGGVAVIPTISGATHDVWWFNGSTPAGYTTQLTLTCDQTATSYSWQVTDGFNLVFSISNNTGPIAVSTNQVTLYSVGESSTRNDTKIRVTVNGETSQPYQVTVHAPNNLLAGAINHTTDPTYVYLSTISYTVQDVFNVQLPSDVPVNEQWSTGVSSDVAMNWRRIDPTGYAAPSAQFADLIRGEVPQATPTPLQPQTPLSTTKVCHWGQEWWVGDATPGVGRRVQTNTLQKYLDHAAHLQIVTPAP